MKPARCTYGASAVAGSRGGRSRLCLMLAFSAGSLRKERGGWNYSYRQFLVPPSECMPKFLLPRCLPCQLLLFFADFVQS